MEIRQANTSDMSEIYELVKVSFESAEQSDGSEHDLVIALSKGSAFVPELSLVAEVDGEIVGYILFTEIQIGDHREVALAPLAVKPDKQQQGIGKELIRAGHSIAKDLGYHASVVLGSDLYYGRFGYVPADNYGIKAPFDVESKYFMFYPLSNIKSIQGVVKYAPEFGI